MKHEVHLTSIYRLLDRHGWRKLVPRPRHRQQPMRKNKTLFKKNFKQAVQAALDMREPTDERPVLRMAEDEGRFGRISQPRRAWAPAFSPAAIPTANRA